MMFQSALYSCKRLTFIIAASVVFWLKIHRQRRIKNTESRVKNVACYREIFYFVDFIDAE